MSRYILPFVMLLLGFAYIGLAVHEFMAARASHRFEKAIDKAYDDAEIKAKNTLALLPKPQTEQHMQPKTESNE